MNPMAAVMALGFGGALGWGLYSGSMPMKFADASRAQRPILFWFMAAIYACFVAMSVWIALIP
ncbi:MAG: hypothetical protein JWR80_296 [Bradyrhizobium sp.]|nr:hypothetical protein [Bradyrhizobium sp.]